MNIPQVECKRTECDFRVNNTYYHNSSMRIIKEAAHEGPLIFFFPNFAYF